MHDDPPTASGHRHIGIRGHTAIGYRRLRVLGDARYQCPAADIAGVIVPGGTLLTACCRSTYADTCCNTIPLRRVHNPDTALAVLGAAAIFVILRSDNTSTGGVDSPLAVIARSPVLLLDHWGIE